MAFMVSFVRPLKTCTAPLGRGVVLDIVPGALPQAELWLPHLGRNRRFRLLKTLLDSHVIPPDRPDISASGDIARTPVCEAPPNKRMECTQGS